MIFNAKLSNDYKVMQTTPTFSYPPLPGWQEKELTKFHLFLDFKKHTVAVVSWLVVWWNCLQSSLYFPIVDRCVLQVVSIRNPRWQATTLSQSLSRVTSADKHQQEGKTKIVGSVLWGRCSLLWSKTYRKSFKSLSSFSLVKQRNLGFFVINKLTEKLPAFCPCHYMT